MCDVWWAEPALADRGLLELLDDRERERHARFRLAADRDRYAVAHALARLAVAREAGCAPRDVVFGFRCPACERRPDPRPKPHGKPRPEGAARGLEISISHSGGRVVLALTRGVPVGVDVEGVSADRDIDGLIAYALTGSERAALEELPAHERVPGFFGYWARKEALLKATGEGLSGGLAAVAVTSPAAPAAVVSWESPDAPGHVQLTDLDAGPGYRAALAALTPAPVTVVPRDGAALLRER